MAYRYATLFTFNHTPMQEEIAMASPFTLDEIQGHPSLIINAFDRNHHVVLWNDRCASHFGISKEDALGKKLEDLLPWVATDEKLHFIDRALMGTKWQALKVPFKLKPGYYDQTVIPVKDSAGNIIAALNIVQEMNA